jgi:fructokinase
VKIASIGEILWDVFDSAEHLGGAVFNFSAHCAQLGHEVSFISAVGADERGRRALERAETLGLDLRYIKRVDGAATGHVTVTVDSSGQPTFVIHRPAAYDFAWLSEEECQDLAGSGPDWICYGTLYQMEERSRALVGAVAESCPDAKRFYDVNLRRDSYTPELVLSMLEGSDVVKLNDEEVGELVTMLNLPGDSIEEFCRTNADRFGWEAVCVTQGAAGCSLLAHGEFVHSPGVAVRVADTVGAGDAFSAAFVHGLDSAWPADKTAAFANRVGALVASRDGGTPEWSMEDL